MQRPATIRWFRRTPVALAVVAAALLFSATTAQAEDPAADFKRTCSSCHTIGGGRVTGPDLKNVTARKDRAWLVKFIVDPGAVLDSGDPYAMKLLEEARNQRMPNVAGMSKARAEALLSLIEEESKKEKSRFMGIQLSDRPFTDADVVRGEGLFRGEVGLKNGGAACIGCHTLGGVGGLGGGRLGPDLTKVFERYENRRKLGTWLSAPATETMNPTFRDHPMESDEILPLVAYFKHANTNHEEDTASRGLIFALLGLAGAAGAVLLLDRLWRRRFRAVRKPLVRSAALPSSNKRTAT